MNAYATHLPILETISNVISCDSVFEFGMGNYSTKLFAEKYKKVIAVEMQEEGWYEEVKKNLSSYRNTTLHCGIGEKPAIEILNKDSSSSFSLMFIDGHGGNRWECINNSFGRSEIIVTHDTETAGYKWNLVKKPKNYVWVDVKEYDPWTSVLTTNMMIVDLLNSKFRCEIREH